METTTVRPDGADWLLPELALTFDGYDVYGWCMGWWFPVAECLYRHGEYVPDAWRFRAGIGVGDPIDPDDCTYEELSAEALYSHAGPDALRYWGDVLARYSHWCDLAGRSY